MDGHFHSFQFCAAMNKAAMNILTHFFPYEHMHLFFLGVCLEVIFLNPRVGMCLNLIDNAQVLSEMILPIDAAISNL